MRGRSESGRMVLESCNSNLDPPPVADPDTVIVYRNQYCALCNHLKNAISWDINLKCSDFNSLFNQLETVSGSEVNSTLFLEHNCQACSYHYPKKLQPPIACLPEFKVVSTCLDKTNFPNHTQNEYQELDSNCVNGSYDLRKKLYPCM